MNPTEAQQLEIFLLLSLNAVGEIGSPASHLLPRARVEAFRDITEPQLAVQLRTLADRFLVIGYGTALGQQRWKITGLGRAALQEAGLA